MKEGFDGAWRFTLAYSCAKSEGAYVFLYYLFLGHLARWLGLSIPFVFHFSRLVNAGILVFTLACLIRKVIPDDHWASRALWLTCLGSSMGYVAMMFGQLSDNERVAEAYPFLSIFGNPHFTLGMAIFAAIVICLMMPDTWKRALHRRMSIPGPCNRAALFGGQHCSHHRFVCRLETFQGTSVGLPGPASGCPGRGNLSDLPVLGVDHGAGPGRNGLPRISRHPLPGGISSCVYHRPSSIAFWLLFDGSAWLFNPIRSSSSGWWH